MLANLGTPAAPTAQAVRLPRRILTDPRVVQLPRWLWRPLLRRVILPRRSPVVAGKYASIWMREGSPLAVHTRRLAQAVQDRLPQWKVVHAMRYGAPSLADALRNGIAAGAREIRVLPLYPQYSTTTTASVADAIAGIDAGDARIAMLDDYHAHPAWIRAVAGSIRAHWQAQGRGERLMLSFHGLPQRVVDAGDPYAAAVREASARAIARELGMERGDIELCYQSRFGKGKWLQPSTDARLHALAAQGIRTIDVACPGFAVDCLETLEEIAQQEAERFRAAGGGGLARDCLPQRRAGARRRHPPRSRRTHGTEPRMRDRHPARAHRRVARRRRGRDAGAGIARLAGQRRELRAAGARGSTASTWSRSTCRAWPQRAPWPPAPTIRSTARSTWCWTSPMRWAGNASPCSGIRWAPASAACSRRRARNA